MENLPNTKTIETVLGQRVLILAFSEQQAQEIWDEGDTIPLSVMPHSYWWVDGSEHPRFSAENLGSDF